MNQNVLKNFYQRFYLNTNGYLPAKPLNLNLYPGDFFQVRNGEIIVLGNLFRNNVLRKDEVDFALGIPLNMASWNFIDGVTKPFSGKDISTSDIEGNYGYTKQVLAFNKIGSFLFHSKEPEAIKISNWNDIADSLILKLTQVLFSFRELYVVTESVVAKQWTLAVGGSENAELEIASEGENLGLFDILNASNSKTIQARDIEFYNKEENKKPSFFKGKKLIVREDKMEVFISDLVANYKGKSSWASSFFEYDFYNKDLGFSTSFNTHLYTSVLDMLQSNQLNPNTCLDYFRWADMNLDDVEKLFLSYGN